MNPTKKFELRDFSNFPQLNINSRYIITLHVSKSEIPILLFIDIAGMLVNFTKLII